MSRRRRPGRFRPYQRRSSVPQRRRPSTCRRRRSPPCRSRPSGRMWPGWLNGPAYARRGPWHGQGASPMRKIWHGMRGTTPGPGRWPSWLGGMRLSHRAYQPTHPSCGNPRALRRGLHSWSRRHLRCQRSPRASASCGAKHCAAGPHPAPGPTGNSRRSTLTGHLHPSALGPESPKVNRPGSPAWTCRCTPLRRSSAAAAQAGGVSTPGAPLPSTGLCLCPMACAVPALTASPGLFPPRSAPKRALPAAHQQRACAALAALGG